MFTHEISDGQVIVKTQTLNVDARKEELGLPSNQWAPFAFLLSFVTYCEEVDGEDIDEHSGSYTVITMRDKSEHIINVDFANFVRIWSGEK